MTEGYNGPSRVNNPDLAHLTLNYNELTSEEAYEAQVHDFTGRIPLPDEYKGLNRADRVALMRKNGIPVRGPAIEFDIEFMSPAQENS